jgi:hypothetical protein
MLLSATTWEEVHKLFKMAQSVGLEALEWIGEAKRHCESVGGRHGWHWDGPEAGALAIHTHLPLSEGQRQIKYGSYFALTGDSPTNDIPSLLPMRGVQSEIRECRSISDSDVVSTEQT